MKETAARGDQHGRRESAKAKADTGVRRAWSSSACDRAIALGDRDNHRRERRHIPVMVFSTISWAINFSVSAHVLSPLNDSSARLDGRQQRQHRRDGKAARAKRPLPLTLSPTLTLA